MDGWMEISLGFEVLSMIFISFCCENNETWCNRDRFEWNMFCFPYLSAARYPWYMRWRLIRAFDGPSNEVFPDNRCVRQSNSKDRVTGGNVIYTTMDDGHNSDDRSWWQFHKFITSRASCLPHPFFRPPLKSIRRALSKDSHLPLSPSPIGYYADYGYRRSTLPQQACLSHYNKYFNPSTSMIFHFPTPPSQLELQLYSHDRSPLGVSSVSTTKGSTST